MSSELVVFLPKEDVGSVSGTEGSSGRELVSNGWNEGPGPTAWEGKEGLGVRSSIDSYVGGQVGS